MRASTPMHRRFPTLPSIAIWTALVVVAQVASRCAAQNEWELDERQFNQWICQSNVSPEERVQDDLQRQLNLLDGTLQLTPTQRQKLELAGRLDIQRFTDRVQELRDELVGRTYDNDTINDIWQRISPLQTELQRGIIDDGSLFVKVKYSTLRPVQRAQLARYEYAAAKEAYHAALQQFVAVLDRSLAMTEDQRQGLLTALMKHTKPPARMGEYQIYYVLWQASETPESTVNEILDPPQRKLFRQIVEQGAGYQYMVEQQGMRPLDEPPPVDEEVADDE